MTKEIETVNEYLNIALSDIEDLRYALRTIAEGVQDAKKGLTTTVSIPDVKIMNLLDERFGSEAAQKDKTLEQRARTLEIVKREIRQIINEEKRK